MVFSGWQRAIWFSKIASDGNNCPQLHVIYGGWVGRRPATDTAGGNSWPGRRPPLILLGDVAQKRFGDNGPMFFWSNPEKKKYLYEVPWLKKFNIKQNHKQIIFKCFYQLYLFLSLFAYNMSLYLIDFTLMSVLFPSNVYIILFLNYKQ